MSHEDTPQPFRAADNKGWLDLGPRDIWRDRENPDILVPPPSDSGTMANMRFSFSDAHQRLEVGGWAREVTNREIPASMDVAGVNMALEPGAYRELHWHKEAEWGLVLVGSCRVTAIDEHGRSFIDDVKAGDLWNFEAGLPHSIQGLQDGVEFLLVFSDPDFSENFTFLLSDWFAHTPQDVVAANFRKTEAEISAFPQKEKYIFPAALPGPIEVVNRPTPEGEVPSPFTLHMEDIEPIESEAGRVRIVDVNAFPAAKTISAASSRWSPAACASCTGTRKPQSGSTTSRAKHGCRSSTRTVSPALSTSAQATSASCPWWPVTTSRTPALRSWSLSRSSNTRNTQTSRRASGSHPIRPRSSPII